MSEPIRAVFFDFAGTLFSDRALRDVHLQQLRFVAAEAGVEASDDELRTAYRRGMGVAYRSIAGAASYQHRDLFGGAFTAMAVELGGAIDHATQERAVDLQYAATVDAVTLRPDAAETLRALRQRGLFVQIVSNIDDEQLDPMIEKLGLVELIDAATSSESAGSCKPDAEIYRIALAKAAVEPAQVLFVGDSPVHDVQGPAAMGMRTAWLAIDAKGGAGDITPDFVIHSLAEVPELILEEVGR
jgi:2-haloalkanoic acid dehalogenase type II